MLAIAIWAVITIALLFVIDVLSFVLQRRGWARFVTTFFLFLAQIIVSEFVLGLVFSLNRFTLVALNLIIAGVILILLCKRYGGQIIKNYMRHYAALLRLVWPGLRSDPLGTSLLVIAVMTVGWVVLLGIIFPATDFDGNSYHLTFVANVIQNQTFFDAPTSLPWLNGYPKGGEFLELWTTLIPNNDTLVDLVQVPFLVLGTYALYTISLALGAGKKQARFSALLFLFLPIVLNQLKTTYVDVMLCSLFFASLAMLMQKKLKRLDLLLVGIALSLLIAVKSTGILFVIALSPWLFWQLYTNRNKKKQFGANYIKPLMWVVLPTVFGLYWYVKNIVLYGTPIYPFGFKLLGVSIFPGKTFQEFADVATQQLTALPHGCLERIWFVWTEQKDWFGCLYNYDTNYAGMGPLWFIVLLPSVIIGLVYAIKKRNRIFLAFVITVAGLFAIYPANYYSRYTIFVAALGICSLALILTYIDKKTAIFVKTLSILLAISVIATNFTLCNYSPQLVIDQLKSLRAGSSRGIVYDSPTWRPFSFLEARLDHADVVAYSSSPYFIYPLWRTDYANKVIYVPARSTIEWQSKLNRAHVTYVFVTATSREQTWARHIPTMKSMYKDELYEIFKVN